MASDITGVSGRLMLAALIEGQHDPALLTDPAKRRLRSWEPATGLQVNDGDDVAPRAFGYVVGQWPAVLVASGVLALLGEYDIAGAIGCLFGVAVIMYAPRATA